jgi:hypothetical protein
LFKSNWRDAQRKPGMFEDADDSVGFGKLAAGRQGAGLFANTEPEQ